MSTPFRPNSNYDDPVEFLAPRPADTVPAPAIAGHD
jgi:hypothetical protein